MSSTLLRRKKCARVTLQDDACEVETFGTFCTIVDVPRSRVSSRNAGCCAAFRKTLSISAR